MNRKKVLVTGAGGALGSAIIPVLLERGFDVIAITSPRKQLDVNGVSEYKANLVDENEVDQLAKKLRQDHARIDAALFLAGAYEGGDIHATDGAAIKRMLSTNFETAFYLAKHVFSWMKTNSEGGRIIFIGSRPAVEASKGRHSTAYALSKSLLLTLAEQLNADSKDDLVESFVVAPDTIDTPDNRKYMPDADFSKWNKPGDMAQLFIDIIDGKRTGSTLIRLF